MSVKEFIGKVKSGEIDIVDHTEKVIKECNKINKEFNYFNTISEDLALKQAKEIKKQLKQNKTKNKKLLGVAISAKDAICVKGVESTAGSKILKGYKPLFDATVIRKAVEQGAIIIGKTSQDEFGFGSFSVNVGLDFKIPKNPFDKSRSCGGSSGGAGGITSKASFPHIALGENTGGSIASPASFCGVFGLTPTYGLVSRYGLIDYGNSLDKIGSMGKTMEDASLLLNTISGYDKNDSTSLNVKKKTNNEVKKIGIIKTAGVDREIEKSMMNAVSKLTTKNEEVTLENSKYGLAAYYLICTSEASTNLAKYCGMRYGASEKLEGNFNEYFTKVRSSNLGEEAKRRIILGTFARMSGYRDAYYLKALKVRSKIIQEYKKLFKKYDVLISPTCPILPPKFDDIKKLTPLQNYQMDSLVVGPNLAGLPHLNIPIGKISKLSVGMLAIADHLQEEKLIQLGKNFEND
tara:strand:- start:471 stop:1859 length:1389 start_codon:yes stop_codon:yes gene_type:complete